MRTLWDKDWLSLVPGKQALYNGLSQFHQSKVCNAAKNIGEEICCLQYCLELFQACQTRSGMALGWGAAVPGLRKLTELSVMLRRIIYHEGSLM